MSTAPALQERISTAPAGPRMELRPYQAEAIDAVDALEATGVRRSLVVIPTGGGKTIVFAEMLRRRGVRALILAHRDKLIRQAVEKYEQVDPATPVGVVKAGQDEVAYPVVVGSFQTLSSRRRLEGYLAGGQPDVVIVDECFPAGTMVGKKRIEDVSVGDLVPSFDEGSGRIVQRRVVRLFRRQAAALVRITTSSGRRVVCTPNHPVWSNGCWRQARSLVAGDEILEEVGGGDANGLRSMRGGDGQAVAPGTPAPLLRSLQAATPRGAAAGGQGRVPRVRRRGAGFSSGGLGLGAAGTVLLLGRLPRRCDITPQLRSNGGHEPAPGVGSDESQEPDGGRRHAGAHGHHASQDRSPAAGARWEREGTDRAAAAACRGARLGDRVRRPGGQAAAGGVAHALQARHRGPGGDGLRGGRRTLALRTAAAGVGCPEGRLPQRARVVGVEVLEPGCDGRFAGLCPDGQVYNLEVEGTHTYVADGLVVHNCHHAGADTFEATLAGLGCFEPGGPMLVGFTATPKPKDKALARVFEAVAYSIDIGTMVDHGYLCDLRGVRITLDVDLGAIKRARGGDYNAGQLGEAMHDAGSPAASVAAWKKHAPGRRGLLFTPTIALAEETAAAFNASGMRARAVSGRTPEDEQEAAFRALRSGTIDVLCNADLLTEGFDEPCVEVIAIARPTRSKVLFTQMIGRGLRLHPGKPDCLVIDLSGATDRASLFHLGNLLGVPDRRLDGVASLRESRAEVAELATAKGISAEDAIEQIEAGEQQHLEVAAEQIDARPVDLLARFNWVWVRAVNGRPAYALDLGARRMLLLRHEEPSDDRTWAVWLVAPKPGGSKRERLRRCLGQGFTLEYAQGVGEAHARQTPGAERLSGSNLAWRDQDPGPEQIALAKRVGAGVENGASRGEVSDAILACFAEWELQKSRRGRAR